MFVVVVLYALLVIKLKCNYFLTLKISVNDIIIYDFRLHILKLMHYKCFPHGTSLGVNNINISVNLYPL